MSQYYSFIPHVTIWQYPHSGCEKQYFDHTLTQGVRSNTLSIPSLRVREAIFCPYPLSGCEKQYLNHTLTHCVRSSTLAVPSLRVWEAVLWAYPQSGCEKQYFSHTLKEESDVRQAIIYMEVGDSIIYMKKDSNTT